MNEQQAKRIADYLESDRRARWGDRGFAGAGYALGAGPEGIHSYNANGHAVPAFGHGVGMEESLFPYEREPFPGSDHPERHSGGGLDPAGRYQLLQVALAAVVAVGGIVMWLWANKIEVAIWGSVIAMLMLPGADYWLKLAH